MQILIFEGIATSGKSTVIAGLQKQLKIKRVAVYGEADTHIPIMHQRSELHIEFFLRVIDRAVASRAEVVLLDRLYMTQAIRAHAHMADYVTVEQRLRELGAQTILLEVQEKAAAARLESAMNHRDEAWKTYVSSKAESLEQVAHMYAAQQYMMRTFIQESLLPVQIYDTTGHEYAAIVTAICAKTPLL